MAAEKATATKEQKKVLLDVTGTILEPLALAIQNGDTQPSFEKMRPVQDTDTVIGELSDFEMAAKAMEERNVKEHETLKEQLAESAMRKGVSNPEDLDADDKALGIKVQEADAMKKLHGALVANNVRVRMLKEVLGVKAAELCQGGKLVQSSASEDDNMISDLPPGMGDALEAMIMAGFSGNPNVRVIDMSKMGGGFPPGFGGDLPDGPFGDDDEDED